MSEGNQKNLIFLYSEKHIPAIVNLQKKVKGTVVTVALNKSIEKRLQEKGIPHRTPRDFLATDDYEKIIRDALSWLQTWPCKRTNSKSFKEILAYQNTSLWWFARSTSLYENFKTVITCVETIAKIVDAERPDRIIIPDAIVPVNDETLWGATIALVGESKNIPVIYKPSFRSWVRGHFERALRPLMVTVAVLLLKIARGTLARVRGTKWTLKRGYDRGANHILVLCHTGGIQEVFDPVTRKRYKDNVMVSNVIMELLSNPKNSVIAVQEQTGRELWLPSTRLNYTPLEKYINPKVLVKTIKATIDLVRKWRGLEENKNLKMSLQYKGINLWSLLDYKFYYLFFTDLIQAVLTFETVKTLIEAENPNAIVMTYETGYYGKAAIIEGKLRKIPTVGLQHGVIHPHHPDYMYGNGEKDCPLPDKLCVYGSYVKKVLTENSAYPPDRIVITGQPRYDVLAEAYKVFDKEEICKRLNLNPYKKIIVVATGGFQAKYGLPDYDERLLDAVFEAIRAFPNTQLIIKLHPIEDGELQRKMISERGLKNVLITKGELYELLWICDLLITFASTVAIEAIILDKPVITVNLFDIPDSMPFARSGAAVGVYKEEDIVPVIRSILEDSQLRNKLGRNRRKFVREHAYRIDGKASRRVVELVEQLIKKSGER